MKAIVIAEHTFAAIELAAGARGLAQSVAVVLVGSAAIPEKIADRAYRVTVPEGCEIGRAHV